MNTITFNNAYYIKLGKKGKWVEESLSKGIARIGWDSVTIEDIQRQNWEDIRCKIENGYISSGKKNGAKQDFNALRRFCDATVYDVFITFYKGKMYWCNFDNSPIESDSISKYRRTLNGWSCKTVNEIKSILYANEISGEISKTQAFQGTLCRFNERETYVIERTLNGTLNPNVESILNYKTKIVELISELLKELHWKDCEILTDLIFLQSGWRRTSMKGGSMEFTDMEYYDPINNERYAVQIKSGANEKDFDDYKKRFIGRDFRKLFFVVFNPDKSIFTVKNDSSEVEILYGEKLSTLIFDLGLLEWIMKKSK